MRWRALGSLLFVGILAVDAVGSARVPSNSSGEISSNLTIQSQGAVGPVHPVVPLQNAVSTEVVECDGSLTPTESSVVMSPVGDRASVEVRGERIEGETEHDIVCRTEWTLHLIVDGRPQTVDLEPQEDEWGIEHRFEIVGWSRDGKLLLMSMITAAGDWDDTVPVVYEMEGQRVWPTELAPMFENLAPKDCGLFFRPRGFDSSGKLMIDVGPLNTEDLPPDEVPCFEEGRWRVDYLREIVERVKENVTLERFGSVVGKSQGE